MCSLELQAGDDFMLVATDGLFQDMSSQEAVDYAADYIRQQQQQQQHGADRRQQADGGSSSGRRESWSSWLPRLLRSAAAPPTPAAAAHTLSGSSLSSVAWPSCSTFLLSRALLHASEKQIGRKQTDADNLLWVARLPVSERRAVHDDCTVVIIHLTHSPDHDINLSTVGAQRTSDAQLQPQIQSKL